MQESPAVLYLKASDSIRVLRICANVLPAHVIDYEKCYFLLGIIKLKAKENMVT